MVCQQIKIPNEFREFSNHLLDQRRRIVQELAERFVKEAVPTRSNEQYYGQWTGAAWEFLRTACPEGCKSRSHRDAGEFLVDFAWVENGSSRVILAAESEWAIGGGASTNWQHVEIDFKKLLSIKAPFKLMVFSSYTRVAPSRHQDPDLNFSGDHARSKFKSILNGYGHHLAGETYLFVDYPFPANGGVWSFDWYLWQAAEAGNYQGEFIGGNGGTLKLKDERSSGSSS